MLHRKIALRRTLSTALLLPLAACGESAPKADEGLATAEMRQLESAAARLDARPQSPGAAESARLEADVRQGIADEAAR